MANARNIFGERPNQAPYNSQLGRLAYQDSLVASEAVHVPISVTGTAPALNVRRSNFFDNGTLTATTSPTFTNVPKHAKWSYSFNSGSGGAGYYIPDTTAVGQQRTFQPIATVNQPSPISGVNIYQINFNADGDKIFFMDGTADRIREYALTTDWDITTIAATETTSYYYGSYESNALDFQFSPDGLHMYVTGTTADRLQHWTLSTAFDLTTIAFNDNKSLVSNPYAFHITSDGTKLFVMNSAETVFKYNFGTAWDASTIGSSVSNHPTANNNTFVDTSAQYSSFIITPDGLTLIANGFAYDRITHTDLLTPHVMTDTANISRHEMSTAILNNERNNYSFGFSFDGKYMWLGGNDKKTISLFDTSSPCQVTLPSSVVETTPVLIKPNARTTMDFVTSDGGATVNLIDVRVV